MDLVIRPFGIGVTIPEERWKPKYDALKEKAKATYARTWEDAAPYVVAGTEVTTRVVTNVVTEVGEWLLGDVHDGIRQTGEVLAEQARRLGNCMLHKSYQLADYHDRLPQRKEMIP